MKHDWEQTIYKAGHKRITCKKCGAIKDCYNIYCKYSDKWTPATLNGKRQPNCFKGGI